MAVEAGTGIANIRFSRNFRNVRITDCNLYFLLFPSLSGNVKVAGVECSWTSATELIVSVGNGSASSHDCIMFDPGPKPCGLHNLDHAP